MTNPPAAPSSVPPPSTSSTPAPHPAPTTFEPPKLASVSPAPRVTPTPTPVQVQQPPRIAVNTRPQPSPTPQPTAAQSPPKPTIPRLPSADPHKLSASPQIRPPSSQPQPHPQAQPAATSQQPPAVQPQQPPQQTQPTAIPIQTQPQAAHPQYPVQFQPAIPPVNFLNQPPTFQKKVSRFFSAVSSMSISYYQGPQPTPMTPNQHQLHLYAYQQQQQQHQHQQRLAAQYGQAQPTQGITSNGTPANINAIRSPMQSSQTAGNVVRPGPLSGNATQTSRSPMPPAQQQGIVAGQHPQQPATVQQMYNYAANPYMARMTPMQQNHSLAAIHAQAHTQQQPQQHAQAQSQPQQPPQTPQMQAATPEQQAHAQAQVHAHTLQMLYGPMINMNYMQMPGRIPPGYQWHPMGYRRPVTGVGANGMNVNIPVNGQTAQMPTAQQMQRAMQGSVQGR